MDLVSLLIQLLSGAVGGNLLGALLRNLSLGRSGNTLAGIVGGGLGGQVFDSALGTARIMASNGIDAGIIITEIVGGGIGGAVLAFAVGLLRHWLPND